MTNELKPCPFCPDGGEPYVVSGKCYSFESGNGSKVECEKCQASGPLCETIQDAIAAWNKRNERTTTTKTQSGCDDFDLCVNCELCNYGWHISKYDIPFKFCPNCGARVIEDD